MSSRLPKYFKILGVIILVLGSLVGMFFRSWSQLPYDSVDGHAAFSAINKAIIDTGGGGFINSDESNFSAHPFHWMTRDFSSLKEGPNPLCLGIVRFRDSIKPGPIRAVLRLLNQKDVCSYECYAIAGNSKSIAEFYPSSNYGYAQGTEGYDFSGAGRIARREIGNIEVNDHLRLNEDFVFIEVGSDMRMYRASAVPPKAQKMIKQIMGVTVGKLNEKDWLDRAPNFGF